MSDELNSLQETFFDTSDNIRECLDWVGSGIQAQILADFNRTKKAIFTYNSTNSGEFSSAAPSGRDFFVPVK